MNRFHRFVPVFVALLAALTCLTVPDRGSAREVHLPIVGRQFVVVGTEVRGGPVLDWSGDSVDASTTVGPRARIGLQHIISESLSMNLEGSAGATWLADHPMATEGDAAAGVSFDFNISVLARYMAIGPLTGWTVAGGVHYRRAGLPDGALLQMGLDGRLGYNVWTDDERFFIVELGVHAPIFEGLSLSQQSFGDAGAPDEARGPDQWYYPSASLGIQWAF